MDCLFCKIVAKEIPNYTVFENDNVLAFLDIHPCSEGHTVVIPKKHFSEVKDLNPEEWQQLMAGVQAAAAQIDARIRPAGMNIGVNNRPAAGQAVPHMHWHIIPRFNNDGGGSMHSIVRSEEPVDVGMIAKLFK
jgi:histidine triad (HIT) family protein